MKSIATNSLEERAFFFITSQALLLLCIIYALAITQSCDGEWLKMSCNCNHNSCCSSTAINHKISIFHLLRESGTGTLLLPKMGNAAATHTHTTLTRDRRRGNGNFPSPRCSPCEFHSLFMVYLKNASENGNRQPANLQPASCHVRRATYNPSCSYTFN